MVELRRQVSIAYKTTLENNCEDCIVSSGIGDILNNVFSNVESIMLSNPTLVEEVSASIMISAKRFSRDDRYDIHDYLLGNIANMASLRGTERVVGKNDAGDDILKIVDITVEARNIMCTYTLNIFFEE